MTSKPPPPAPFVKACSQFHANIGHFCPTFESMSAFALQRIEESDRETLAGYLDSLLSGNYADDELKELWNSSGADVFIPDVKNIVALFTEMRRQLRAD